MSEVFGLEAGEVGGGGVKLFRVDTFMGRFLQDKAEKSLCVGRHSHFSTRTNFAKRWYPIKI